MSNSYGGSVNAFDGLGKAVWLGADAGINCVCNVVKHFADKWGDSKKEKAKELFHNVGMDRTDRDTGKTYKPQIIKQIKTAYGVHLIVKTYPGLWVGDFFKYHPQIESALNAEVQISQDSKGLIHLRVFTRAIPRRFKYTDKFVTRGAKWPCAVPVGIGREGVVWLVLSDDECFSVLVAGMPGGGKSSWLRQALMSLITNYTPDQVKLHLVDMKLGGVELSGFQLAPHTQDFACDLGGAERVLTGALRRLQEKAIAIGKAHVSSIADYNALGGPQMAHDVVVIDEWMSLDGGMDKDGKGFGSKGAALTLLQQGRFAGMHVIICTQHTSAKVVSGELRSLIPTAIAFKVSSRRYSRMILGEERSQAAYLEVQGRCIFQAKERMRKVQVMHLHLKAVVPMLRKMFPAATKGVVPTVLATEQDKESALSW